jgi:hypothetical protein
MSRGFSIDLKLESENSGLSTYSVVAGGWNQPKDSERVASIKIDHDAKTYDVILAATWENEAFYFPPYSQLLGAPEFNASDERINKTYWWWNVRLISAMSRIITNPEYREHVWFYQ